MKNNYFVLLFLSAFQIGFTQTTFGNEQIIEGNKDFVRVHSGDIDGDGDQDVIAGSGILKWYENDGTGKFISSRSIDIQGALQTIYLTDLDGDNDLDILCESRNMSDNKIVWFANDGRGNFSSEKIITNQVISTHCVYAADLDNDGDNDVLSASVIDDKIAWYENEGNGNFSSQKIISSTVDGASTIYASDIDGDGDLDIIAGGAYDGSICWFENIDGKATFGSKKIISGASQLQFAYTADLDNDGDQDIYFAALMYGEIGWIRNNGNGNFSTINLIDYESKATDVFAQDIDNDGDLDIISSADNGNLSWFENNGLGEFGEQIIISDTNNRSVYSTDLNGDGKYDILTASFYAKRVSWYENKGFLQTNESTSKTSILIYPNPTKNILNILSDEKIETIEIINSSGQKILNFYNVNKIDISNLTYGIYFIKIRDNIGNITIKKIQKQ
ncbi:T9SS type A sorting domain-containing protein [Algoriella sp.]|uniref:T9SS type A sorting domain-containing protein n=1 Tax=Algoriella sp. TaxID=1872434 RepID=UPI002FCA5E32